MHTYLSLWRILQTRELTSVKDRLDVKAEKEKKKYCHFLLLPHFSLINIVAPIDNPGDMYVI